MRVLTVNAGSSSLKLSLVRDGTSLRGYGDLDAALADDAPDAVGHRVVHGGHRSAPELIDDTVRAELGALTELAPLHQPAALRAIDRTRAAWPGLPQVACFDPAFHTTLPPAAATYALPARLRELGVHAYGFHGLSHAWAAARAAERVPGARRVLVAHLGAGASLCAVLDGRSVDTTMGFTPLDGLVMATRCGALDPGAVTWLAARTAEDLTTVLERESGLLGLCGTADMREVITRAACGERDAQLALEVWWHRLIRLCGSMIAAMGGLDVLVLTGGIGEHSQEVRTGLIDRLSWLGLGDTTPLLVVPAREDLQIAAETSQLLS
ncbi:MAG TPA: acetate/propionate family kinase [Pseudonocardiaceae bacterium]|nr:acetate/propionate family kinase [Pseudonocardiaceae bacterium]